MLILKHQVPKATLRKPVCIGVFNNDGFGRNAALYEADKLRNKLNEAKIRFAAINYEPPIKIFVAQRQLNRLEKAKIKFPIVCDSR